MDNQEQHGARRRITRRVTKSTMGCDYSEDEEVVDHEVDTVLLQKDHGKSIDAVAPPSPWSQQEQAQILQEFDEASGAEMKESSQRKPPTATTTTTTPAINSRGPPERFYHIKAYDEREDDDYYTSEDANIPPQLPDFNNGRSVAEFLLTIRTKAQMDKFMNYYVFQNGTYNPSNEQTVSILDMLLKYRKQWVNVKRYLTEASVYDCCNKIDDLYERLLQGQRLVPGDYTWFIKHVLRKTHTVYIMYLLYACFKLMALQNVPFCEDVISEVRRCIIIPDNLRTQAEQRLMSDHYELDIGSVPDATNCDTSEYLFQQCSKITPAIPVFTVRDMRKQPSQSSLHAQKAVMDVDEFDISSSVLSSLPQECSARPMVFSPTVFIDEQSLPYEGDEDDHKSAQSMAKKHPLQGFSFEEVYELEEEKGETKSYQKTYRLRTTQPIALSKFSDESSTRVRCLVSGLQTYTPIVCENDSTATTSEHAKAFVLTHLNQCSGTFRSPSVEALSMYVIQNKENCDFGVKYDDFIDSNIALLKLVLMTNKRLTAPQAPVSTPVSTPVPTPVPTTTTTLPTSAVPTTTTVPTMLTQVRYKPLAKATLQRLDMRESHVEAYMRTAFNFSECSTSAQNRAGAVCVKNQRIVNTGYSETLDGSSEVLHAECNCIARMARQGTECDKSIMFVTHEPCLECCKMIRQVGIQTLVYCLDCYQDKLGLQLLERAGIEVIQYTLNVHDD